LRLFGKSLLVLAAAAIAAPAFGQEPEAKGSIPGLSIVIQDLKRERGNSVILRFQMINASDKTIGFKDSRLGAGDGVYLIDNANKTTYPVARNAEGKCLCSAIGELDKSARANLWAKFAAPPETVTRIGVVVPGFQPIDGVPITR